MSMDDPILRTAIAHEEQWVDRSARLNLAPDEPVKVVLLALNPNGTFLFYLLFAVLLKAPPVQFKA